MTKDELRRLMDTELKSVSLTEIESKSLLIESSLINHLSGLSHQPPISVIGMYLPMRSEPHWDWKKWSLTPWQLAFPSKEGVFKVPQSLPQTGVWVSEGAVVLPDILIIPGLAFSSAGYRLGRGAGWYDKLLASFRPRLGSIGVCFDQQFGLEFESEAHDQKLQMVLTDRRKIFFA